TTVGNLSAKWHVGLRINQGTWIKYHDLVIATRWGKPKEISCALHPDCGSVFRPMVVDTMRLVGIEQPAHKCEAGGNPYCPKNSPERPFFHRLFSCLKVII